MRATIYDGKNLVARLSSRIKRDVEKIRRLHHIEVGLGILLVTGDQVSMADASKIATTAEELGIKVEVERVAQRNIGRRFFPRLEEWAESPFIQGIYVQLPLPLEILTMEDVMQRLPPSKDVAGIHFINRGMSTFSRAEVSDTVISPEIMAVTAALRECKVELKRGKITLIGSGSTGGMMKLLAGHLYDKGCDIRLLKYENLVETSGLQESRLKSAAASGASKEELLNPDGQAVITWANQPEWLTAKRLSPGCVILDMGYRFGRGKISGDCDFVSVSQIAKIITPVPGGVRNIVRIMILQNLIDLIKRQVGETQEQPVGPLLRRFGAGSGDKRLLKGAGPR